MRGGGQEGEDQVSDTPNPGSPEAVAAGCRCPVLDNRRGRGYAVIQGETVWCVMANCPMHGQGDEDE